MQTSKCMSQTNIFFERGNHGRPCKCFRKGKWCNYKLVSKHGLYMKTVFLFETWKSPLPSAVFKGIPHQGKWLNGSSVSRGWAARSGVGAPGPSCLCPSAPASSVPSTSSCPSGAHLGARLAQDALEPWDASSHLFVYSLPASQTELFIRMKAGIPESNPTDRIWALCFFRLIWLISVSMLSERYC